MSFGDDQGVWGNYQARGRRVISDPRGGSPVLGDWVWLPGPNEISYKGEVSSITGGGGDETCVNAGSVKQYSGKGVFARESLSALKLLLDGTVTSSGSTPNQQADYDDTSNKLPKIELQWRARQDDEAPNSDVLRTFYKMQVTNWESADKFESASMPSFEFIATRRKSDGKRFTSSVRETGADLVEGAIDTTPPTVSSFTPLDGASGVNAAGVVTIVLSANVDPVKGSDPGSYYYTDTTNGNPVAFSPSYNAATHTMVLTPTASLTSARKYAAGTTMNLKNKDQVRATAQYGIDFTIA